MKYLVTGTLMLQNGDALIPADDAEIRLFRGDRLYSMTITDPSGRFRHALCANSGEYEFEFVADGYPLKRCTAAVLEADQDLGVITLPL
ncbi:MAG: carboxypeptidase-like regulatory domain-containing protein [Oscillospiraceae bacterium]|nr:carboxypeptidase-like regulatory domain-containing protein [Oscillospiraceae bacterium]